LTHELDLVVVHAVARDAIAVGLEQIREIEVERALGGWNLAAGTSQRSSVRSAVGTFHGNPSARLNGAPARSGLETALELLETRLNSAHQLDKGALLCRREHVQPLLLGGVQAQQQLVHDPRPSVGDLHQQHAPI